MNSPVSPTTEPATIQLGSVILGSGVEAAAAAAEASFNLKAPDVAGAKAAAVRHAALAAAVAIESVRGAADELRSPASVACVLRRQLQQDRLTLSPRAQRKALTLGVRLERMQARDRGLSFTDILRTIAPSSYIDNLRKVWQRRSHYKSLDAASQRVSLENGRGSHFGSIDKRMYDWFLLFSRRGRERILFTISLTKEKARQQEDQLGVCNFKASRSWVQRWTQRHDLKSVVLHRAG